jgi:hypothetical protein
MQHRLFSLMRRRRWTIAAGVATLAAILSGIQLATPEPAAAIQGLERRTPQTSIHNRDPVKSAKVECGEADHHVIGGGGAVLDGGRKLVRLTGLLPYDARRPYKDSFTAVAVAPELTQSFDWSVTAYAICAPEDELTSYQIVPQRFDNKTSKAFWTAWARCPSGTVTYGAGAYLPAAYSGRIGLQLNRTSEPLDISRATARESTSEYSDPWSLWSYAICAERQGALQADWEVDTDGDASTVCSGTSRTHGAGGGGGLTDGGPVWLQKIYPNFALTRVDVAMTGYPQGGVVAHQTCAF